jgi:membrane-bound serine protease (ClpP class)
MYSRHARSQVRTLSSFFVSAIVVVIALMMITLTARTVAAASPHVDVVTFNMDINPASEGFLTRAISTAEQDGASALVIQVDSPGGDIQSMKNIVEAELKTTVPIISYVTPTGAYAASAGAFITLAAQIAAMAPTTRIGASSPIDSTGANLGSTLQAKIENDLIAFITGIQNRYNRNLPDAVSMVTKAISFDDTVAISDHLVDMGANSLTDLLNKVNGQTVTLVSGPPVALQTAGASIQTIDPSLFDTLYGFLLDPNVSFLLFIVAIIGIYLEVSHPGVILPGTVGGIALILFLFSVGSLNPNWAGLALMILAFALLVLDLRLPTHGVLTVGALISLVVGSLIFFNSGGSGVPQLNPYVLYGMAAFIGVLSFALISVIVRTQRKPVTTGVEGMLGTNVTAITPLLPEGRVSYGGEDWAAVLVDSDSSVDAGSEVQIVAIEGLRLHVRPLRTEPQSLDTYSVPSLE